MKFYYLIVLIYQIVSETKDQTEREFGSRLGRSIVASSTAPLLSAKRARLEERQKSNIPVEKIVIENNLKFGEREIQMMKVCERSIVCIFRLDNQFDICCGRRDEDEYV